MTGKKTYWTWDSHEEVAGGPARPQFGGGEEGDTGSLLAEVLLAQRVDEHTVTFLPLWAK